MEVSNGDREWSGEKGRNVCETIEIKGHLRRTMES